MNKKQITVPFLVVIALGCFYLGIKALGPGADSRKTQPGDISANSERFVRSHSPTLGPQQAPVTIVEFFDPACEACRAFYPLVKDITNKYPDEVRLVLRYALFHPGSEKIVRLLEASREQDKYWQVLEAVLTTQPMWADHDNPNIDLAYKAAQQTGLDLRQALADATAPKVDAIVRQDMQDVAALKVEKTPTFFVNGEGLASFGRDQLSALVTGKVTQAQQQRNQAKRSSHGP